MGMIPSKPAGYFGDPASLKGILFAAAGANRFFREGDMTSKQSTVDFYEHARSVAQVVGSVKDAMMLGEHEEAMRILEENPVPVAFKKAFARAQRAAAKYTKQIRMTMLNFDIDSETKGKELKRLRRERTAILQRMFIIYRKAMQGSR